MATVPRSRHLLHRVSDHDRPRETYPSPHLHELIRRSRFVEETLQHHRRFDAARLVTDNPSASGRLHYWTNEMCLRQPQRFDFVVTVRP